MRRKIGMICIILGVCCLLTAIGFVIYNRCEEENGATTSQTLLENVQLVIQQEEQPTEAPTQSISPEATEPESTQPVEPSVQIPQETEVETLPQEMPTVPAGDYTSIGILSIPVLELELPILADWSYEKLKSAPCHYYGTYYESNFVIAGHNYTAHFGKLSHLQAGDLILFTDATGTVHCYEVVLLETLAATATEEMITSGFDLSLYTCTLGGSNRITVRCKAVNP